MHLDLTHFTPVRAILGGLVIGLATAITARALGRVAGISGIVSHTMMSRFNTRQWQTWFFIGLCSAGVFASLMHLMPSQALTLPVYQVVGAGALVGWGTRLGSGCTSGHGICGNARLSIRSMIATVVFMLTGMLTVTLIKHAF